MLIEVILTISEGESKGLVDPHLEIIDIVYYVTSHRWTDYRWSVTLTTRSQSKNSVRFRQDRGTPHLDTLVLFLGFVDQVAAYVLQRAQVPRGQSNADAVPRSKYNK